MENALRQSAALNRHRAQNNKGERPEVLQIESADQPFPMLDNHRCRSVAPADRNQYAFRHMQRRHQRQHLRHIDVGPAKQGVADRHQPAGIGKTEEPHIN